MSNIDYDDNSFFTISKTAKIIGVQSHVLRFWEKKFNDINPKKSLSGRRYYSSRDINFLLMIKKLLYEDGFTIKGAINFLDKNNNHQAGKMDVTVKEKINYIITLLQQASKIINKNLD